MENMMRWALIKKTFCQNISFFMGNICETYICPLWNAPNMADNGVFCRVDWRVSDIRYICACNTRQTISFRTVFKLILSHFMVVLRNTFLATNWNEIHISYSHAKVDTFRLISAFVCTSQLPEVTRPFVYINNRNILLFLYDKVSANGVSSDPKNYKFQSGHRMIKKRF